MAETLGTVEVVAEDVADAGEISGSSSFTLLIVGDEVVSVVTAAVAAEVAVVVVIIATFETSGVVSRWWPSGPLNYSMSTLWTLPCAPRHA